MQVELGVMFDAPRSLSPELRPRLEEDMLQVHEMARGISADDRSLAIVGTAFLETILTEAVAVRLPVLDDDLRRTLFDPNNSAPLSAFSAKVHMARAMNAVAGVAYNDLKYVGRIRNCFAHNVRVDSFEHPLVEGYIRKLQKQEQLLRLLEDDKPEIQDLMRAMNARMYEPTGRGKFACSIANLANGLFNATITNAGFGASCLL